MTDFTDVQEVLKDLAEIQGVESDIREFCREQKNFIHVKDGQWETDILQDATEKPRYTFDQTEPLIDQIAGEIEKASFSIRTTPVNGQASTDVALLFDGMIRNIENLSGAESIYDESGRSSIECGLDGWVVKQKFVDGDSFDQDLVVDRVANFIDSVYYWSFTKPDASDAPAGVVLQALPKKEYEERWPEGSGQSVPEERSTSVYYHKPEDVIIGQLYYLVEETRTLALLSDNQIVDYDEFKPVEDEYKAQGVTVVRKRTRKNRVAYSRLFDGSRWLNEPQKTVFNRVPVVPVFGNFTIIENKLVYRGATAKLIDPQRVYNYSKSREIEEGALAPRDKYWMTPDQMSGHEDTLKDMNVSASPVQPYNPDPAAPGPPQRQGGAKINPGLKTLSDDMSNMMRATAGQYAASVGDNPNAQSGIAIERLQNRGSLGSTKYFRAVSDAICATGRILVDAIPKVYDTRRQVRILGEDGQAGMTMLNATVLDSQTGQPVKVNDLSVGKYDVVCEAGPSFKSRQREVVDSLVKIGQVDPTFIQLGGDVLARNMAGPEMNVMAERLRRQLFQQGMIPDSQLTEAERAEAEQARQNPPPPDPAMVLAQAEAGKAEADQNKVMVDAQVAQANLVLKQSAQQFEQLMKSMAAQQDARDAEVQRIGALADGLKALRDGFGVETILGPGGIEAFAEQIGLILLEQQKKALAPPQ